MNKLLHQLKPTRHQLILSLSTISIFSGLLGLATLAIKQTNTCPVLEATSANQKFIADNDPDTLTLLVYNLKLRPRLVLLEGQTQRVEPISQLIQGYDAVILTEGFDDGLPLQTLLKSLQNTYPYISDVVGSNRGVDQDTGLFIASRWPIIGEPQVLLFQGQCRGFSCFNDRGVFRIKIDKDGAIYHLITAQLQAGTAPPDQQIRQQQLQAVTQVIQSAAIAPTDRVIFGGSLPIDPISQATEYQTMRQTLAIDTPKLIGPEKYTVNPKKNPFAAPGKPKLLDHLFYARRTPPTTAQTHIRPLKTTPEESWKPAKWFYWSCPWQDLSDHYAIEGRFEYD
ncbi:hypothetical protein IQ266_23345 [filamentous cyanobacterium LEGE 11480]|uniref:Endonuclease/exonuclease/phosphatase domain-containing protein n=1 Tax=Romeriopsis navalis LEGE 11480 TaxID=2777977 RepID=A0A928VQ85_9CYAN|nr:endonuclease/exonuclease/phosphatase family protein [Romeriopsis navalis]MBE9032676.1 hypothetical protein [Romeriopsis navalis LEGE 11480]